MSSILSYFGEASPWEVNLKKRREKWICPSRKYQKEPISSQARKCSKDIQWKIMKFHYLILDLFVWISHKNRGGGVAGAHLGLGTLEGREEGGMNQCRLQTVHPRSHITSHPEVGVLKNKYITSHFEVRVLQIRLHAGFPLFPI